jgi:hypothetical protein
MKRYSSLSEDTKDTFILKRNKKEGWSGSVSALDGYIEEIHSYREAENNDFHHNLYFSISEIEKMRNEESLFFWVQDGKINVDWRTRGNQKIVNLIKKQVIIK